MRIALFDYKIRTTNPIGGCHRQMLAQLADDHEFTVFAVEFDNPRPDRIRFVRIPAPQRPLALLFVVYHALAPIYLLMAWMRGHEFDCVQAVESNAFADVTYAQFCHKWFLSRYWKSLSPGGLRGAVRWLDHKLHALLEPLVYWRAQTIVVASQGLRRELSACYPSSAKKIVVVANPVDTARMSRPEDFDRTTFRSELGIGPEDVLLNFVALGQYERKGLPLLLEAMNDSEFARVKLIVVGGTSDLVDIYARRTAAQGLGDRVRFVGMQSDVRPYLWSCDAFVLPSAYEVFPLVALEAAAAAVPMIVSPLNGLEEFVVDGSNALLVERSAAGVAAGLRRFCELPIDQRARLGERAQADVRQYSVENFARRWRAVYDDLQIRDTELVNA